MKKLLAFTLSLVLLVTACFPIGVFAAETGDELVVDVSWLTQQESGEYRWHFADEASRVWSLGNTGHNRAYRDGIMEVTSNGNGYLYHQGDLDLDTSVYKYFVVRAKNTGNLSKCRFYFRTTTQNWSEAAAINIPLKTHDGRFREYYVDLSTLSTWNGSYRNCMLVFGDNTKGENGMAEVSDIYLTSDYTPEEVQTYTHMWDFAAEDSHTWSARNGDALTYHDGVMEVTANGGGYINHENVSLNTEDYRYLVVRAKSTGSLNRAKFYFTTSTQGASESATVTLPLVPYSDTFIDYYVDLSRNSLWQGEYRNCMLQFGGDNGERASVEVEKIYFTSDYTPEPCGREYHYPLTSDQIGKCWGATKVEFPGDGIMVLKKDAANGGAAYVEAPKNVHVEALGYPYLVVLMQSDGALDPLNFYFSVSTISEEFKEDRKVSLTATPYTTGGYRYYYAHLGSSAKYYGWLKRFMISCSDAVGSVKIKDMYLTDTIDNLGKTEMFLRSDSDAITTDEGTLTLRPEIVSTVDIDGAVDYMTDSVAATLTKNEDGSATLTGKINGTVTVTAILKADPKVRAEKTVTISGQPPRTAAADIKLLTYGNSIMAHGPSEALGWLGETRGMAASSIDKDYVHVLISTLESKYGKGAVEHRFADSISVVENGLTTGDAHDKDYSSLIAGMIKNAADYQPNIITLQMGENGGSAVKEVYENLMTQIVTGLREAAPDALIVITTPFWGGAGKVNGATAVSEKLNVPIAFLHTLDTDENKAYGLFEHGGVAMHPGDLGMQNIAKLFFEQINIARTANEQVVYTNLPNAVEFTTTENTVTTDGGTLAIGARVLPADAAQDIIWTVDNTNLAVIDANGVLTAKNNGTVTVRAASRYNSEAFAELTVTVSGQSVPYTVTYDANTSDTVTGMPAANPYAKGEFTFDAVYPERETYHFVGWALTPDGDAVDSVTITSDVTVYAVWEKATRWSFDREDYKEGFNIRYGFNQYVRGGVLNTIATGTNVAAGEVLEIVSPTLDVPAADYKALAIRMQNTAFAADTVVTLTVKTASGDVVLTQPVTTTEFTTYSFDLSSVSGTITGFALKPTNVDASILIDEIGFVGAPTASYHANTTATVSGMPGDEYFAPNGMVAVSKAVPTRKGYTFLGWAKKPDSKLLVGETVEVTDGAAVDLYAVWDRNDHWEMDNNANVSPSNCEADFKDGVLHYVATLKSDNTYDPIVGLWNAGGYDVSETSGKIVVRMKWNAVPKGNEDHTQIFFTTPTANLSEGNSVKFSLTNSYGIVSENYQDVLYDFTAKSTWSGELKSLRCDLTPGESEVYVDYIRFTDSEANIVTDDGEIRAVTSDAASYIVKNGGTLAPQGKTVLKALHLGGDVDMSNGYIVVSDTVEIDEDAPYAVFTLNMNELGVTDADYMHLSGYDGTVEMTDGAKYLVKLGENGAGFVTFGNRDSVDKRVTVRVTKAAAERIDDFVVTENAAAVRIAPPMGVRYRASVTHAVLAGENGSRVKEYGYLVSTAKKIEDGAELTFKTVADGKAKQGVAYANFGEDKNVIYDVDDEKVIFTAVLIGIPETKDAYNTEIYIRPYMILENGTVLYGSPVNGTVYGIAVKLYENTEDEAIRAYLEQIIEIGR